MTDAAAKMPRSRCLKGCSPSSQTPLLFLLVIPTPLSLRSPPLPPALSAILVAVPPDVLSQQKSAGQGQLGAKAGRFGARYPLGVTRVGVLRRPPARNPKARVPTFGREKANPRQSSSGVGGGGRLCSEKARVAEGSVTAVRCAGTPLNNHFGLIGEGMRGQKRGRGDHVAQPASP